MTNISISVIILVVLLTEAISAIAYEILISLIQKNGGSIRTAEAVSAGVSGTTVAALANRGLLERVARGQYALPNSPPDELFYMQQRMKWLVYSHETALFLHDMAERTPARASATIPSNIRISKTFPGDIKIYWIKPELYAVGIVSLPTKMGHTVRVYDAERTVCDILRSRSRIDDQSVTAAIRNYSARDGHDQDWSKLGFYAEIFHVTKKLRHYFEVLM